MLKKSRIIFRVEEEQRIKYEEKALKLGFKNLSEFIRSVMENEVCKSE